MSELDQRLRAAFAPDETGRDLGFTIGVLKAVERRRLVAQLIRQVGLATAVGAVLWAVWPSLVGRLVEFGPAIGVAVSVIGTVVLIMSVYEQSPAGQKAMLR